MKNKLIKLIALATLSISSFMSDARVNFQPIPIPEFGQPMAAPIVPQIGGNQFNAPRQRQRQRVNTYTPNHRNNLNTRQYLIDAETSLNGRTVCIYSQGSTRVIGYGSTDCPRFIN